VTTLPGFGGDSAGDDTTTSMDARARMVRTLDLDDGADDEALLKAVRKLQKKTSKLLRKLLEQQAAEKGLVLMDVERVRKLERDAAGRAAVERQLHSQRFEHVFELALNDPRGARVAPAEKDRLHKFYELDAEGTLTLIEECEPIVQAQPKGSAAVEVDDRPDPQQLLAAGVHPTNHHLHTKLVAKLRELGKPMTEYATLLDQVHRGEVTL
jgi:hypothetical protein